MLSIEELQETAVKMQKYLETKPGSEPNDLIERAENLSVLIAKSGQCLADARYIQDMVVNGAILEAIQRAYEEKLSASTINKFVATAAKTQNHLVNWFDRINSAAVHQLDSLRSILSYRKTEMINLG
jgi:hypothetical protein